MKEKQSSKKATILKDINEREIYRAETSLSSLKTEILLDDQLTENDKKKSILIIWTAIGIFGRIFIQPIEKKNMHAQRIAVIL